MKLQVCTAVNNIIEDKTGQSIATCWGSQKKKKALAKELVRRWNSHEKIVNRCGEIGVERDVAIGELDTIKQQRDDLLAACEMIKNRLLTHGEWDDECFYYAGRSASELEEPLKLIKAAIEKAKA